MAFPTVSGVAEMGDRREDWTVLDRFRAYGEGACEAARDVDIGI